MCVVVTMTKLHFKGLPENLFIRMYIQTRAPLEGSCKASFGREAFP